jgi:membrane-associated phospholipid phosphatase
MLLIGTAAFIAIAADVTHHGLLAQADRAIAPFLHAHATPWLVLPASAFSGLGEFRFLCPLAVAVGIWLIRRRQWRALATWSAGLLGGTVICGTLKAFFAIPRPSRFTLYTFDLNAGYTFPSGHTMGALLTAGLLALLWARLKPRPLVQRVTAAALTALVGVLVAAALVYIGVHYLSDVLAALSISLAWLGALRWILPPAYDSKGADERRNPS